MSAALETVPKAGQERKIVLSWAVKEETLECAFVLVAWGSDDFPDMRTVPKCRVNGILKPFKVTKHDLSILDASSCIFFIPFGGSI